MSSTAIDRLKQSISSLSLSSISGNTIKLNSQTFDFDTPITFSTSGGKTLTYSLISLFLQLQNPSINFKEYAKLCKEHDVKDKVKVTDKKDVLHFFQAKEEGREKSSASEGKREETKHRDDKRDSDRKRHRDHERDHHRSSSQKDSHRSSSKRSRQKTSSRDEASGSTKKRKEEATPITHEQLLENLKTVVDRRSAKSGLDGQAEKGENKSVGKETSDAGVTSTDTTPEEPPSLLSQEDEDRKAIQECLSASGYEANKLSQEMLEKDRAQVEKITNFEIPVGNSGSILRCGAMSSNINTNKKRTGNESETTHDQRNFARVLDLFKESEKEQHQSKNGSKHGSRHSKALQAQESAQESKGNPIIIVPNAMTSPITLMNAEDFFQKAKYTTREKSQKIKESTVKVSHVLSSRLGGGTIEFDIIDNPKRLLRSPSDWDRVVAVLAQGEAWQFKGWKMGWTKEKKGEETPVEVFSKSFGFYIGFEGAPVPQELMGWSVKHGFLSRDKRGVDTVVSSGFWNGLDEWMKVHKRHFLPKS